MKLLHFANWVKQMNLPFIVMNIGLCVVLFWIGLKKFTPAEAVGISPFITNSPFVSWTHGRWALGTHGNGGIPAQGYHLFRRLFVFAYLFWRQGFRCRICGLKVVRWIPFTLKTADRTLFVFPLFVTFRHAPPGI
jgi:hypothetical protein